MRRDGMVDLIEELRVMCDAEREEFTLAGETYWTDEQLQAALDRHRCDERREPIEPAVDYSGNDPVYQDYFWEGSPYVERAIGGSAVWKLEDSSGNAVGTALYTVNYAARQIRFTNSTDGSIYFLTYKSYDVNRAAADVWRRKAATVASRFDVKTDNHDLKRSQLRAAFLDMANYYNRQAGSRARRMERGDINGS